MTSCKGCGFQVNELMKFALMQNVCPSCGGQLFSDKDSNLISTIQSKLSSERFSSRLTEELLYDISLFIFNELKSGLGQHFQPEIAEEEEDPEVADIRREIAAEYSEELDLLDEGDEDFDLEEKAEKLKKINQQRLSASQRVQSHQRFGLGSKQGQRVSRST